MDIRSEIDELRKILEPVNRKGKAELPPDLPMFEIDTEGNFITVPDILEKITGFSGEELSLLSLQNVVFVEDRHKIMEMMEGICSGSRIMVAEIEIFSEEMGSHPVELIMLPLMEDDALAGMWGAIRDLESRMGTEEELETKKKVQESSRQFLQDFVSLMAREIRQPMTTILLTLEMLDSGFFGEVNQEQREKIGQLISLVDRLKGVVREALETSRNLGEEIEPDRKMVSLGRVVEDVLKGWKDTVKEKDLRISTDFGKGSVSVPADRKMMYQVIDTLVENSIDLSPEGGNLMIELEEKESELQFSIADSGEGLHEDEVGSIFDKLHVDQDIQKGSFKEGLNLYMAKKVVESHGGRIWCESFKGIGSTFLFTIPMKKEVGSNGG